MIYGEKKLAEAMGVPRWVVKNFRDTSEDIKKVTHWHTDGTRIVWTDEGVRAAVEILKLRYCERDSNGKRPALTYEDVVFAMSNETPPESAVTVIADVEEELIVTRVWPLNRKILDARRANGEVVRVAVRNNVNFLPGMAIPGVLQSGTRWYCGRKAPRYRGRW
ncbi:MAG: hypothetical protein OEN50_03150 [Deltaproteobacteria bacterium]|nr:hypothetical protein [Deltaproteobacteria bacterium]